MANKDGEKSQQEIIAEYFSRITEGMNKDEVAAVFAGFQQGMQARLTDVLALERRQSNAAIGLLSGLELGMKDEQRQLLLARHRLAGDSVNWLQEQVSISLQEAVDIALDRPIKPTNIDA